MARGASTTRDREDGKVRTEAQLWARLRSAERIVVLACVGDEPIAAPYQVLQSLERWGVLVPTARGFVLTDAGVRLRDFGVRGNG
jgi:hypothetical protein